MIDIDEELYDKMKTYQGLDNAYFAIKHGTPLPEGHGRLIDADNLEECKEMMTTIMNECKYAVLMDEIRNVPTIIEADTESEDEEAFNMAIKALEQGSILDKIREEIEQVKSIMNEEIIDNNRKDLINFVNGLDQSLAIIDKYKVESEDEE